MGLPVRRRVSDPVPMGRWVRLPTTKAVRDGNSQPIPTAPSLSFGISWKDKYISKEKRRKDVYKRQETEYKSTVQSKPYIMNHEQNRN